MTTLTSLNFSPNPNITNNGMFTPQLTQAEINAIPVDTSKIGGIIYNSDTQELQYLSPALQWVNVSTDQGEPTFTELTVTGPSVLAATSVSSLNISGDTIGIGKLYGKRPGAAVVNNSTPPFSTTGTVIKIPGTTLASYATGFLTNVTNRLTFAGITGVTTMTVRVTGAFYGVFSVDSTVRLSVGINGTANAPIAFKDVSAGTAFDLIVDSYHTLNNGDYVELMIGTSVNGDFSTGGTMTFACTEA